MQISANKRAVGRQIAWGNGAAAVFASDNSLTVTTSEEQDRDGENQTTLHLSEGPGVGPLVGGNDVKLLVDGDATFRAMLRAISTAKSHINLETYIILDDKVGRRFTDALMKKRAEGVVVNLIYDSFGSRGTRSAFFDRLRAGGINVIEFNPLDLSAFRRIGQGGPLRRRTHRKLLIVDGTTAFVGGINIGEIYMKKRSARGFSPNEGEYWRDTHVMIRGPVVSEFQKLFMETWADESGPSSTADINYFPPIPTEGPQMVQAVSNRPGYERRTAYMAYICALARAERSIYLTQSYFVPDDQTMKVLCDAAKRGVDVRIILPGRTDHFIVREAGRQNYAVLLASGVKIYERSGTILHAKTAVVDGVWSTIGSMNLELWSLASNDEANAVIVDPTFGAQMERLFRHDLSRSQPITKEQWNERALPQRLVQFLFSLFYYWM
jgi:cardiolipin synthase A/B